MMQQILARCVKDFENNEVSMLFYDAVRRTFDDHPGNVDKVFVLLKFIILNDLYWTNIKAKSQMVNHIHKLATKKI